MPALPDRIAEGRHAGMLRACLATWMAGVTPPVYSSDAYNLFIYKTF